MPRNSTAVASACSPHTQLGAPSSDGLSTLLSIPQADELATAPSLLKASLLPPLTPPPPPPPLPPPRLLTSAHPLPVTLPIRGAPPPAPLSSAFPMALSLAGGGGWTLSPLSCIWLRSRFAAPLLSAVPLVLGAVPLPSLILSLPDSSAVGVCIGA